MYDRILVALDGSESSRYSGQAALVLSAALRSSVTACHIYGVDIHKVTFSDLGKIRSLRLITNESLSQIGLPT